MGVGPELEEVQEVVQIDLPVPLGIDVRRQVHPRQLAGKADLPGHLLVMIVGAGGVGAQDLQHPRRLLGAERLFAALVVGGRLPRQRLGSGDVELAVEDRVARRVFVDVGGAVADPLPGDEDRQLHMQLHLAHLEGRGVAVAHEIADQPLVVRDRFRTLAIGDAGGLHDGAVIAHVVDHPHEAVVEHLVGGVEMALHPLGDGAQGRPRLAALGGDLGLLFGGEGHGLSPLSSWMSGRFRPAVPYFRPDD